MTFFSQEKGFTKAPKSGRAPSWNKLLVGMSVSTWGRSTKKVWLVCWDVLFWEKLEKQGTCSKPSTFREGWSKVRNGSNKGGGEEEPVSS